MIDNQDDSFPDFEKLIEAAPEVPSLPLVERMQPEGSAMCSLTIAEITGKNHADVMRDIRTVLEQAEIGLSKFAGSYFNSQNKEQPCYFLPRFECDLVVSGYSVKYRAAIIKRWHELEAKPTHRDPMDILKDPAAMRGLLLTYSEKVLALQTTVSEMIPKVEALERIAKADGTMCITNAAKVLNMRPKDLFQWLHANHWIFRRGGAEWNAYQSRLAQGVMDHKVTVTSRGDGSEKTCIQALVTSRGLAKLAEILGKEAA
jgi:phage antirepressor YoqD-like protein